MIKPNWDSFKTKFSENPQDNFQWLCYLLFCKEFNKPLGIPAYQNHRHIETTPVTVGDEVIGWQAKFYDTKLTDHKSEIIALLKGVKKDYPNITKVIFYINKNWTQGKKHNDPKQKVDIDTEASKLGIQIDWNHLANFFESEFVSIKNESIAKHFFSLDKSIFDLINSQQSHSENILNEIQTNIIFNGQYIKVDRNDILEKIRISQEKVLILSGAGGVGKTAVIKDFYEGVKDTIPLYIFKATEFELRSISEFIAGFSLQEFLDEHKGAGDKIIVIDSAEKLLDLKNTAPFKEFLSVIVKENWKVIFTTRDNYLEDLNYQFFEIYRIAPLNINVQNLDTQELNELSDSNRFSLPADKKLLDLIKNPFYLNEYLKLYKEGEQINYTDFKDKLWNKIIIKAKPAREQCFLKIALWRATDGQFFINPDCESDILDNELKRDGILGYESPHGYFITHDIYEEWALEKNIEIEFEKRVDNKTFFKNLGSSLPLRRAFRKWVSEKLLLQDSDIKTFIEQAIKDSGIESFWKDEILVSVLLSDFSSVFFDFFKNELLNAPEKVVKYNPPSEAVMSVSVNYKYERSLLHRIFFLLRIACKEIDDDFFKQLGVKNLDLFSLSYVFTRPKGHGWESLIKFVFENFDEVGLPNIHFILPIIHDWTSKFKEGETTKFSGLMALKYYEWTIKEDVYISDDGTKDRLLQIILYSANEIRNELEEIFKEIIKNKWKNHRDPYVTLSETILSKIEGVVIAKTHPRYVLELADLFWSFTPKEDHFYGRSGIDIEEHFNMEDDHLDYFPASAYQTPVYWLLQSSLQETIDFILKFTNKTVEYFAKSEFATYEVEEVEVFIDEEKPIKQYDSRNGRLWNMYRGSSAPAPYVLQSMHMALEKFFLEKGMTADPKTLESWLLYLIKNSRSTSVSAVVASIILAYPEKTFNVAKILFKTKDFFPCDTGRLVLDQGHKNMLLSLRAYGRNSRNEIYEEERLTACDEKHRTLSLENLFLNYQLFRNEGVSENESKNRQEVLWQILDGYYNELPSRSKETENDKTWRLYLARMDRRKMKIETEKKDDQVLISFNPEIDPELRQYSEDAQTKSSEAMKYLPLQEWARNKFEKNDDAKKYTQYEENSNLVLAETKTILEQLANEKDEESKFRLFYHAVPPYVCAVLLRDYSEKLSSDEVEFCKDVTLDYSSMPLRGGFGYQAGSGLDVAVSILPLLIKKFPKDAQRIKEVLLFILFDSYPIGMSQRVSDYAVSAILQRLWQENADDANALFYGYLMLKPKFDAISESIRVENRKKNVYDFSRIVAIDRFKKECATEIKNFAFNKLSYDDIQDIVKIDPGTLVTAFLLIPLKTSDENHKRFLQDIIPVLIKASKSEEKEERLDYVLGHVFHNKFAYFVLNSPKEEIEAYVQPFTELFGEFRRTRDAAEVLEAFVIAEDVLNKYEEFWTVWKIFYPKIVELCSDEYRLKYSKDVVYKYLLALEWNNGTKEWRSLKDGEKVFFKKVSEDMGGNSVVLYSIAKLLNDIGSGFVSDGIAWVSDILEKNPDLSKKELEVNTVYYLENLVRSYILKNRQKIKTDLQLKKQILIILDFLLEKASVVAYLLREDIL